MSTVCQKAALTTFGVIFVVKIIKITFEVERGGQSLTFQLVSIYIYIYIGKIIIINMLYIKNPMGGPQCVKKGCLD